MLVVGLVIAAVLHAPTPADVAQRIETLLDTITAEVAEADVGGYMALVDPDDRRFLVEQRNWIRDLRDHPPDDFDLALDPATLALASQGHATADVLMSWRYDDLPRSVRFAARFVPLAHPHGPWLWAGPDLVAVPAGDDVVRAPSGLEAIASVVARRLPAVRRAVSQTLGLPLAPGQQVVLYPTMDLLQASIWLRYDDPLGGWNEPDESIKILAVPGLDETLLDAIVAHELAHAASFEFGLDSRRCPWWVLEGLADFASRTVTGSMRDVEQAVAMWHLSGSLAEWADLADFHTVPDAWRTHVYFQGAHFIGYVTAAHGPEVRTRWLRRLAQGDDLDAAARAAFGIPFRQLSDDWRATLGQSEGTSIDDTDSWSSAADDADGSG